MKERHGHVPQVTMTRCKADWQDRELGASDLSRGASDVVPGVLPSEIRATWVAAAAAYEWAYVPTEMTRQKKVESGEPLATIDLREK